MTGKEYHTLNQSILNQEARAKQIENDLEAMKVEDPDTANREKMQFMEGTANGLRLAVDSFRRMLTALNE